MCWFDVGIAQIALDPFPLSNGQMWKKSAPNHPGKPLHPRQMWKKSAPSHPSKPLHPPPSRSMPIWKQHILKRGSVVFYIKLSLISVFLYSFMANGRSNQRRQWQNRKTLLTLLSPVLASLDITSFVKNEYFICGNEMNQPIIYRIVFNDCSKSVNLTPYAARAAGSHEDKSILGRGRTQLNQIG